MLARVNGDNVSLPIPVEPATSGSPTVLPLTEIGKKTGGQWTLTLQPSHLALAEAPGERPYVLLREQLMKSVILMEGTRALVVQQPRKIMFKLTPAGVKALAGWMGKPFLAAFYLKRRYAWVAPWALLWVLGSLITLMPSSRSGTAPHFDAVSFALGMMLLTACAFAKWRPHPALFLVDSVWFASVAINLTASVVYGRSKGWLVLVALMAWMAVTGLRHFVRFRGTKLVSIANDRTGV
jgi:hypothetical protein